MYRRLSCPSRRVPLSTAQRPRQAKWGTLHSVVAPSHPRCHDGMLRRPRPDLCLSRLQVLSRPRPSWCRAPSAAAGRPAKTPATAKTGAHRGLRSPVPRREGVGGDPAPKPRVVRCEGPVGGLLHTQVSAQGRPPPDRLISGLSLVRVGGRGAAARLCWLQSLEKVVQLNRGSRGPLGATSCGQA